MSNQIVIQNWLIKQLAEQLSLDTATISITEPLTRYGLDSIDAVTMVGDIEDVLDVELPSTLFWDYPTIEKSSQFLAENYDLSNLNAEADRADELEETAVETANSTKGWGGLFGRIKGA
jgi:acyl carrier protein